MDKRQELLSVFHTSLIFNELMAALSLAIDMDAGGKLYHAWRVSLAAGKTARLIMPEYEADVFYAGLLHDLGAMGLDDHIVHQMLRGHSLSEPDILAHSAKGAEITGELPAFTDAALYIRDHHEKWDGSGIPGAKKGEEISLGGQLVAIADQFDFLLRLNPNNNSRQVLKILQARSGKDFAPQVVDAFLAAVDEEQYFPEIISNESLPGLMKQATQELPIVKCTHPDPVQATVRIFAKIIDAKHVYTGGHSQRVAEYGILLGNALGLRPGELENLGKAGLLHDFGKISVPGSILDKPARLSEEEFALIKKHPARTAELLETVQDLKDLAWIAGGHHERYDGKGYPLGLKGKSIPFGARILAVADAFDAMTSNRSYQESRSFSEAYRIISKNAGSQFDPEVAEAAKILLQ